ncbi:hypothetical protein D9M72_561530 [compost metagenome]
MLEQPGDGLGTGVDMALKLLRVDIGRATGLGTRQGGGEVRPRSCGGRCRDHAVAERIERRRQGIDHRSVSDPGTADLLHARKPGSKRLTHR